MQFSGPFTDRPPSAAEVAIVVVAILEDEFAAEKEQLDESEPVFFHEAWFAPIHSWLAELVADWSKWFG